MTEEITALLQEHDPRTEFHSTENSFSATLDTMTYVLHEKRKRGGYSRATKEVVGPNVYGLIIELEIVPFDTPTQWPANMKVQMPYWNSILWHSTVSEGDKAYIVARLKYGKNIGEDIKRNIMSILNKAT